MYLCPLRVFVGLVIDQKQHGFYYPVVSANAKQSFAVSPLKTNKLKILQDRVKLDLWQTDQANKCVK